MNAFRFFSALTAFADTVSCCASDKGSSMNIAMTAGTVMMVPAFLMLCEFCLRSISIISIIVSIILVLMIVLVILTEKTSYRQGSKRPA